MLLESNTPAKENSERNDFENGNNTPNEETCVRRSQRNVIRKSYAETFALIDQAIKENGQKVKTKKIIDRKTSESDLKIAPVFAKAVPKPKIDPLVLEARRNFLQSGVPSCLKKAMEKQQM